jgi:hypothetical protein
LFRRSVVPLFRRSVVPSFRRSVVPSFRRSVVPSFRRSVVQSFRRSVVPSFRRTVVLSFDRFSSFLTSFFRLFFLFMSLLSFFVCPFLLFSLHDVVFPLTFEGTVVRVLPLFCFVFSVPGCPFFFFLGEKGTVEGTDFLCCSF